MSLATLLRRAPEAGAVDPLDAEVALRVQGLTKRFGDATVLDALDLQVRRGEVVSVVGASGCGKTTLLALIAGLDRPTSGTVDTPSGRPALMFQDATLLPWLTARRNVELALRLRGLGRAERTVESSRLLAAVHLAEHAEARVHELSGGMRQRVSLARALAQGSDVLLMDEPFAALDAITRDTLHDELLRAREQTGATVLFVTHNVREAVRLGDRVVLLSSRPGRVVREWVVPIAHPRRIESPEVGALSVEITEHLREEIRRHG